MISIYFLKTVIMPIKYRNTLRSKALNKEVLIELLKKKPTRKIIVTDIILKVLVLVVGLFMHIIKIQ